VAAKVARIARPVAAPTCWARREQPAGETLVARQRETYRPTDFAGCEVAMLEERRTRQLRSAPA
jgi:hypothetical protein